MCESSSVSPSASELMSARRKLLYLDVVVVRNDDRYEAADIAMANEGCPRERRSNTAARCYEKCWICFRAGLTSRARGIVGQIRWIQGGEVLVA